MAERDNETANTTNTRGNMTERQPLSHFQRSPIRVLHVDDSPELVKANSRHIEQYDERLAIELARSPASGMDRLGNESFDCLISDYHMPGTNGVEFLKTVHETQPQLPFILYTNHHSETVLTEALSAGVFDYVQKQGGTSHLKLLADKIITAVESQRARQVDDLLLNAMEVTNGGVGLLDENGRFIYVNDALADHVGSSPEELIGTPLDSVYQSLSDICVEQCVETPDVCECTLLADESSTTEEYALVSAGKDGLVLCQV